MKEKQSHVRVTLAVVLSLLFFILTYAGQQRRTLILTGHAGELPVVEMDGRTYVEIEALARIANGSVSFSGNQIVLTLPDSASTGLAASQASQSASAGLSKDFIRAGIEEMSIIREWRSTLTTAVQRGYPITEDWIASYRDRARQALRLTSVAASTDSDRNAFQFLTNVFNNMNAISDRFLQAARTQTYIPNDALDNDPVDQGILNCAHALAGMAANGQFVDEAACH